MGFYLSKPITEKETITGDCSKFNYVLSGMQGKMKEDLHNIFSYILLKKIYNVLNLIFLVKDGEQKWKMLTLLM